MSLVCDQGSGQRVENGKGPINECVIRFEDTNSVGLSGKLYITCARYFWRKEILSNSMQALWHRCLRAATMEVVEKLDIATRTESPVYPPLCAP